MAQVRKLSRVVFWFAGLALLLGLAAGLSPARAAGADPPAAGPAFIEQLPPGFGVGRDTPAYPLATAPAAYAWHTFYGGAGSEGGNGIAVAGSDVYLAGFSYEGWTGPGEQAPLNAYAGGVDITVVKTSLAAPEMAVLGNGVEIAAGSASPLPGNHTDFGSLLPGQAVTRTFTISNSGTADLNLAVTPPVSITGPAAGDFSVVSQPATPVAANGTTTFQVRFAPIVSGTRVATVTIASNDDDENPYDFAIGGTGIGSPVYGSTPPVGSSIDLGRAALGQTVTASLTISNSGSAALEVTGHSLSGPQAAEFRVTPAGLTLPAGGPAQNLSLACTPAGGGPRAATLAVTHTAAGSPAVYSLACSGGYVYLPVIIRMVFYP